MVNTKTSRKRTVTLEWSDVQVLYWLVRAHLKDLNENLRMSRELDEATLTDYYLKKIAKIEALLEKLDAIH